MKLLAGPRCGHIKQALGFIVFPPALQLANPGIDATLLAVAADGSNYEFSLLLFLRAAPYVDELMSAHDLVSLERFARTLAELR